MLFPLLLFIVSTQIASVRCHPPDQLYSIANPVARSVEIPQLTFDHKLKARMDTAIKEDPDSPRPGSSPSENPESNKKTTNIEARHQHDNGNLEHRADRLIGQLVRAEEHAQENEQRLKEHIRASAKNIKGGRAADKMDMFYSMATRWKTMDNTRDTLRKLRTRLLSDLGQISGTDEHMREFVGRRLVERVPGAGSGAGWEGALDRLRMAGQEQPTRRLGGFEGAADHLKKTQGAGPRRGKGGRGGRRQRS